MAGNAVEIEGIKDLARTLRKVGNEGARDMLIAANKQAAQLVETAARPMVPVKDGNLLGSLKSAGNAKGGVVQVGKKLVPYAGPIHFGWGKRHIHPQPFLYDAMDKRRNDVEDAYHANLERLLELVQGA